MVVFEDVNANKQLISQLQTDVSRLEGELEGLKVRFDQLLRFVGMEQPTSGTQQSSPGNPSA